MKRSPFHKTLLGSCVSVMLLAGCTSQPMNMTDQQQYAPLYKAPETTSQRNSDTFRRRVDDRERFNGKRVSYQTKSTPILQVINDTLGNMNVIPEDSSVNLRKAIDVRAVEMPVEDFLSYLESASGYELTLLNENTIVAASFVAREFNLAAFSTSRYSRSDVSTKASSSQTSSSIESAGNDDSSTSSNAGTTAYVEADDDHWGDLIDGARDILGVKDDDEVSNSPEETFGGIDSAMSATQIEELEVVKGPNREPFLSASRATGLVVAAGTPERMRLLSSYFDHSNSLATKQVHVDFKMYDVTLRDSAATGIDWNALADLTINDNPISLGLEGGANFINGENVWGLSGGFDSSDVSVDVLLKFLKSFGKTELINQPSLTLRNGATSVINAGEQLSYVGNFEQAQDVNGNISQSPVIERIQVGVTLQVTARVLGDERIMLDIVPVVSSISGSDSFSLEGNDFSIPRTALQQLSTQVITRSGRPIKLGGLITKKIASELSGLPFQKKGLASKLSFFFDSQANDLEKRELVLIVTPQIIEEV